MKTKMLAFDTSSTKSGWAYFENGILKTSGVVDEEKEKDSVIRVENMCFGLTNLLKKYSPDIVVIETPPLVNSPKTLVMLAEIVGVVKGWSICSGFAEFVEFSPPGEWRKLVAREDEKIPTKRNDCKKWDIERTKDLFHIDPKDDNEADAILMGQARINQFKDAV